MKAARTILTIGCLIGCSHNDAPGGPQSADTGSRDTGTETEISDGTASSADTGPGDTSTDEFVERARDLVSRMTLEEKVSQMGNVAPAIERLGIPAHNWWNEALHGVVSGSTATVFPQSIALASTFSPDLMLDVATAISTEARVKANTEGKPLTYFSPTVNLARDPRWGRNEESYGEDPYLASRMGAAFVTGMQGDDPKYLKTVSTAKHFIANNEEERRFYGSSDVDERNLREFYMPAFKAAVTEGGALSVMCAYNALNGIPSCANEWLLAEVLRDEWRFQGYVVSDCMAIDYIANRHQYVSTNLEASDAAIQAGTDLNCGARYQADLVEAVNTGLVAEQEVDTAVIRLFTARFKLGEFDPPESVPYTDIPSSALDSPEHRALALRAAHESMVLLKNDGVLPFDPNALDSLAVIGPNAARAIFGGYSGNQTPEVTVTPLEGIQEKAADFGIRVEYAEGTGITAEISETGIQEAADLAAGADAAVVVVGIDLSVIAEFVDRPDIALPDPQEALLQAVFQANPDTVAVLVTGAPLAVVWAHDNLPAILNAWYGGQAQGTSIADILFGDVSPSGRLPQTFYRSADDLPAFDDYDIIGGKRTYQYFEGPVLYPFGHGLGYTEFVYSDLSVTPACADPTEDITIAFNVENTGAMAGDEVIQIYVRDVEASVPVPRRQLKRFQRVPLSSGESRTVTVAVSADELSFFDVTSGSFTVEPGELEILVGASSEDIRLTGTVTVTAP